MRRFAILALLVACSSPGEERERLPNSSGKDDSFAIRLKLTASNPVANFTLWCDSPTGCDGFVRIRMKSPEPCTLFPENPRCGIATAGPLAKDVLTTTIVTSTEGTRAVPLRIESNNGDQFNTQLAAAFTGRGDEDLDVTIEKAPNAPDMTIEIRAEWKNVVDPGAEVEAVKTFLAGIPGMTAVESGTQYPGYRAFTLTYDQPIDHANPMAGSFKQTAVLHHKTKDAPMILFTSGYDLFSSDYLSELGVAMTANQLSTEQRWFGTSIPPTGVTPESWKNVNIEQAAKDHHRFVQALEPFYNGSWLSTGHSKGGMTSVFHRRFFPEDVDATVAYVAPISFANPDPRYIPHLDQIGEEACRNGIRAVQKRALERFSVLQPMAEMAATGETFVRAGGHASAFEKSIILLEWLFWQHMNVADCGSFLTLPMDDTTLYQLVTGWVGVGLTDRSPEGAQAYYYQAETQLGLQAFSTTHLTGLTHFEQIPYDWSPAGTNPVHDPAPMTDVQNWVKTSGTKILFLYGQYDPWSGGAYDIGTNPNLIKVVAPKAPHAAMISNLAQTDRELVLRKIEEWTGKKPSIGVTPNTQRPTVPRLF